jgi:hypothetical protein
MDWLALSTLLGRIRWDFVGRREVPMAPFGSDPEAAPRRKFWLPTKNDWDLLVDVIWWI